MLDINKINTLSGTDIYWNMLVDSTNTQARKKIFDGARLPFAYIADVQTAGRGRMGRKFYSRGGGIYMSFAFKTGSVNSSVSVTTAAAAAVTKALYECCDGDFQIKWVNDIYQNGKKVCGILTEAISGIGEENYIIVGIGINVGKNKFPVEIRDIAGSVTLKSSKEELIARVISLLREFSDNVSDRSYMDFYREHFMLLGESVSALCDGKTVLGRVTGVDDDGGLLLLPDGEAASTRIFSGEVTIRPTNDLSND